MAISPLPEATVRMLGSTQALTTVTSLVKELIDNALDARATSIDILITPNTLDKIEVRDNGFGIPQDDLDSLGRRGYTSKLRSFEELKTVGGISLGFRGEALFSAVQLGQVAITTKTDGEQVATSVKLKPLGGVFSQIRVSHPVGTTITVSNFLSKLPVRHQTALKEAPKTIGRIKELLQSYSLARPHVRFNLKVTKGGKGSWSFAPRSTDGIKEVVSQVIGRDASTQCIETSISFSETGRLADDLENDGTLVEESGDKLFRVDVFLPRPDADFSKVSYGQYISIDGRPVSSDRGTMKRIITTFKRYVRSSAQGTLDKVKNPFLRLAIKCPVGSYDPNVEPAKDDVLFCNEYTVLEELENVFKDVYGQPPEPKQKDAEIENPHSRDFTNTIDNFELLLARQPRANTEAPRRSPVPASIEDDQSEQPIHVYVAGIVTARPPDIESSPNSPERSWHVDMSQDYNEEVETPGQEAKWPARRQTPFTPGATPASNPLNLWLIAKLTAPVRGTVGDISPEPTQNAIRSSQLPPTPQQSSDPTNHDVDFLDPVSPRVRRGRPTDDGDLDLISTRQNMGPPRRRSFSGYSGPMAPPHYPPMTAGSDEDLLALEGNIVAIHRRNDFTSARNLVNSQPLTSTFPNGPKRQRTHRPFVSPILHHDRSDSTDGFRQTTLTATGGRHTRRVYPENNVVQDQDQELAWAMDFEDRKEEATRRRKEELRAARLEAELPAREEFPGEYSTPRAMRASPHKNRYSAAVLSLTPSQPAAEPPAPVEKLNINIPDGDPRGYFIRRQKSLLKADSTKISRVKSMRLPLEKIPENEQLTSLTLLLSLDLEQVKRMCEGTGRSDVYVREGNANYGLIPSAVEKDALMNSFRQVVEVWKENAGGEGAEVEYRFENLQFAG